MSTLCVQCCGMVADCFLIYLRAVRRIERLIPAQRASPECVYMHCLYPKAFMRVPLSWLVCPVLGMCSSLAVPQEGSVGLWARSPPASSFTPQHGRYSQAPMMYSLSTFHTPPLPLASPFLGIYLPSSTMGLFQRDLTTCFMFGVYPHVWDAAEPKTGHNINCFSIG